MKKLLAIVAVLFLFAGATFKAYKVGADKGYTQGWSDANCGTGNDCEAGQE